MVGSGTNSTLTPQTLALPSPLPIDASGLEQRPVIQTSKHRTRMREKRTQMTLKPKLKRLVKAP